MNPAQYGKLKSYHPLIEWTSRGPYSASGFCVHHQIKGRIYVNVSTLLDQSVVVVSSPSVAEGAYARNTADNLHLAVLDALADFFFQVNYRWFKSSQSCNNNPRGEA